MRNIVKLAERLRDCRDFYEHQRPCPQGVEQRYGPTVSSVQFRDGKEEGGDSWEDISDSVTSS
jgi:hypothetical protein